MANKSNIVNLGLHKNTLKQRKRKKVHDSLIQSAKLINEDKQITSFLIVGWSDLDNERVAYSMCPDDFDSISGIPERVKDILRKNLCEK